MTHNKTLRIELAFRTPAEAVFDAWTSEEVLRRWWQAEPDWERPRPKSTCVSCVSS